MDSAHINNTRKFPAYTLKELQAYVIACNAGKTISSDPVTLAAIEQEIAYRLAGISRVFVVPQIK